MGRILPLPSQQWPAFSFPYHSSDCQAHSRDHPHNPSNRAVPQTATWSPQRWVKNTGRLLLRSNWSSISPQNTHIPPIKSSGILPSCGRTSSAARGCIIAQNSCSPSPSGKKPVGQMDQRRSPELACRPPVGPHNTSSSCSRLLASPRRCSTTPSSRGS